MKGKLNTQINLLRSGCNALLHLNIKFIIELAKNTFYQKHENCKVIQYDVSECLVHNDLVVFQTDFINDYNAEFIKSFLNINCL